MENKNQIIGILDGDYLDLNSYANSFLTSLYIDADILSANLKASCFDNLDLDAKASKTAFCDSFGNCMLLDNEEVYLNVLEKEGK